jgi:putative thiamine transport system substrate-binding protein
MTASWTAAVALGTMLLATAAARADFETIRGQAAGQTVYFNAWGGDDQINGFVAWVGERVREEHGVELVHVRLTDTAEAVGRVVAERAAGRDEGGSVDLVWINGENFRAMKEQELLLGPFTHLLPHFELVDVKGKPTTVIDFTVPTDGYESPWGMAQFVFLHDGLRVPEPPRTIPDLLTWILSNPGRFTYPAPPDFIGGTFLKHVLIELIEDESVLDEPVDEAAFLRHAAPMLDWLEAAQPSLWRQGFVHPVSGPAQHQLLDDGEVDISMAFNPAEASRYMASGRLPDSVRTFILEDGTIANTHFVAIPYNASSPEGAMVVADFLLTPEAQARMQHPDIWGDGTVLDLERLDPEDRARFEALPRGIATLPPDELLPVRLEPHPSWMRHIETVWLQRFGS